MKLPASVWPNMTEGKTRRKVAASLRSSARPGPLSKTFIIRRPPSLIRARARRKNSSVTRWNGMYGPPW